MIRIERILVVAACLADAQKAKTIQPRNERCRRSEIDAGKGPIAVHSSLHSKMKVA